MRDEQAVEERFVATFGRLYPRARRVAYRVLGDVCAAEDVAAEAMARAYAQWERIESLPWVDAWVLRVTANLALDVTRRRRPRLEPPAVIESEDAIATRLAMVVALNGLPRRQREAVALHYLAGLTDDEVAGALGIATGTVKAHVHRGLKALRRALGEDGEEDAGGLSLVVG
jgi:RNA polymerase sigma factor (sigma-70 family)